MQTQNQSSVDFPGIERHLDVCGGDSCVTGTRIQIWLLEQARQLGATEIELLEWYPTLHSADLTRAWRYAQTHTAEIEQAIRENETA